MKKIEVISINGSEVDHQNQPLIDELKDNHISTRQSTQTIFRMHKARMPYTHAWLVKEGMIEENQALTWSEQVTCCM